jgi:hypothetical protein
VGGAYLHSPSTPSWRDAQLGGAQGQLYLYVYLGSKVTKEIHGYDTTKTLIYSAWFYV